MRLGRVKKTEGLPGAAKNVGAIIRALLRKTFPQPRRLQLTALAGAEAGQAEAGQRGRRQALNMADR
jgi:hypothetical protein